MVQAGPDTIGTVLDQVIAEVSALAADKAGEVRQALDDAGRGLDTLSDEARALPADTVKKIKDLCDPPDWWSLLLAVLVEISTLDPHLSVGTMHLAGWSRMVTVTYTTDPPDVRTCTVGLAITDAGLKHGLSLRASAPLDLDIGADLRVVVSARDQAAWTWEFGHPVEAPDGTGRLDVDVTWQPPVPPLGSAVAGIAVGPLHLHAALSTTPPDPLYALTLSLGVTGRPGLEAHLHPAQALGALGQFVHVTDLDERYSPQVDLVPGQAPRYTLAHEGI